LITAFATDQHGGSRIRNHPGITTMTDLFLDCEWADVFGTELVSIALVSMNDEQVFYAEREVFPADPTPFVAQVVYPLLDRGDHAMTDTQMARALRRFLAAIDQPRICHDAETDRTLCQHVLDGFEGREPDGPIPADLRWHLMSDIAPFLARWWAEHPECRARRHHALIDAKALRAAYLSLWGV
jgi:hypothetical protein